MPFDEKDMLFPDLRFFIKQAVPLLRFLTALGLTLARSAHACLSVAGDHPGQGDFDGLTAADQGIG